MTMPGTSPDTALVALAGPLARYKRLDASGFSGLVYRGRCALMGWSLESVTTPYIQAGEATSPTAGQTISSIGSMQAGRYSISFTTSLGGTPGAGDYNNLVVHLAGTPISNFIMLDSAYQQPFANPPIELDVGNGQSLGVHAINAGTSGAIYSVVISAKPLDSQKIAIYDGSPDDGLEVATDHFAGNQGSRQWLGPAGILLERGLYVVGSYGVTSGQVYYVPLPG